MRFLITAILIVCSGTVAFSQTPEEYRVYNAVIRNMFSGDAKDVDTGNMPRMLVIVEELTSNDFPRDGDVLSQIRETFPGISSEAVEDYGSKLKLGGNLTDSFDPKLKHMMVSRKKLDSFYKNTGEGNSLEGYWENYYKAYPGSGGYIGFSRVGFNKSGSHAILYFQHPCGSLCASGYYLWLKKSENEWKVKSRRMLWIS